MRLTKPVLTGLTTDKPDHVFWDSGLPGFGVRCRGATKRFIIQYRINGRQRREVLGDIRKVELDAARKIAKQRFAAIQSGTDPALERGKAKAAAAAAQVTLGFLCARYLDSRRDVVRAGSLRDMTRYFTVAWKPLRDRPVDSIPRAHIAAELQNITKASGRVAAGRARAYLSAAFAWGMREALCDSNPVIGTNNPDADTKSRDRVLSDDELRLVWNACDGDSDFDRIVRLLILLGCRRQEIGSLRWTELDLDAGTMTIPGSRTKSGNTLELALPDAVLEILQSMPRRDSDFVFGGAAGFTSWSISMVALRRRIVEPMAQWSLHDLRRTFRSGLGRIGTPPHIAERLVGHAVGGSIEKIYDRYRYTSEMQNALLQWAERVAAITEGRKRKVVTLQPA